MYPISTESKLSTIRRNLSDITAKLASLVQAATSGLPIQPQGARPTSGPGSRLTETERQDVLSMFKRPDLYTVPQIAAKHRITRAAVYLIGRGAGLTEHMRETSPQAYPLERLMNRS